MISQCEEFDTCPLSSTLMSLSGTSCSDLLREVLVCTPGMGIRLEVRVLWR